MIPVIKKIRIFKAKEKYTKEDFEEFYNKIESLAQKKKYELLIDYFSEAFSYTRFAKHCLKNRNKMIDILLNVAIAYHNQNSKSHVLKLIEQIVALASPGDPRIKAAEMLIFKRGQADSKTILKLEKPETSVTLKEYLNFILKDLKTVLTHPNALLVIRNIASLGGVILDATPELIRKTFAEEKDAIQLLESIYIELKKIASTPFMKSPTTYDCFLLMALNDVYQFLPNSYSKKNQIILFLLKELYTVEKKLGMTEEARQVNTELERLQALEMLKENKIEDVLDKIKSFESYLKLENLNESHLTEVNSYRASLLKKTEIIEKMPEVVFDLCIVSARIAEKLNNIVLADQYYVETFNLATKISEQRNVTIFDINALQLNILEKRFELSIMQENPIYFLKALPISHLLLQKYSPTSKEFEQLKLAQQNIFNLLLNTVKLSPVPQNIELLKELIEVSIPFELDQTQMLNAHLVLIKFLRESKDYSQAINHSSKAISLALKLKTDPTELYLNRVLDYLTINPLDIPSLRTAFTHLNYVILKGGTFAKLTETIVKILIDKVNNYLENNEKNTLSLLKLMAGFLKDDKEFTGTIQCFYASFYYKRRNFDLALSHANAALSAGANVEDLLKNIKLEMPLPDAKLVSTAVIATALKTETFSHKRIKKIIKPQIIPAETIAKTKPLIKHEINELLDKVKKLHTKILTLCDKKIDIPDEFTRQLISLKGAAQNLKKRMDKTTLKITKKMRLYYQDIELSLQNCEKLILKNEEYVKEKQEIAAQERKKEETLKLIANKKEELCNFFKEEKPMLNHTYGLVIECAFNKDFTDNLQLLLKKHSIAFNEREFLQEKPHLTLILSMDPKIIKHASEVIDTLAALLPKLTITNPLQIDNFKAFGFHGKFLSITLKESHQLKSELTAPFLEMMKESAISFSLHFDFVPHITVGRSMNSISEDTLDKLNKKLTKLQNSSVEMTAIHFSCKNLVTLEKTLIYSIPWNTGTSTFDMTSMQITKPYKPIENEMGDKIRLYK